MFRIFKIIKDLTQRVEILEALAEDKLKEEPAPMYFGQVEKE